MNALGRDAPGVDLRPANAARIQRLIEDHLLVAEGSRLRPTLAGLAVADGIARGFVVPG